MSGLTAGTGATCTELPSAAPSCSPAPLTPTARSGGTSARGRSRRTRVPPTPRPLALSSP